MGHSRGTCFSPDVSDLSPERADRGPLRQHRRAAPRLPRPAACPPWPCGGRVPGRAGSIIGATNHHQPEPKPRPGRHVPEYRSSRCTRSHCGATPYHRVCPELPARRVSGRAVLFPDNQGLRQLRSRSGVQCGGAPEGSGAPWATYPIGPDGSLGPFRPTARIAPTMRCSAGRPAGLPLVLPALPFAATTWCGC